MLVIMADKQNILWPTTGNLTPFLPMIVKELSPLIRATPFKELSPYIVVFSQIKLCWSIWCPLGIITLKLSRNLLQNTLPFSRHYNATISMYGLLRTSLTDNKEFHLIWEWNHISVCGKGIITFILTAAIPFQEGRCLLRNYNLSYRPDKCNIRPVKFVYWLSYHFFTPCRDLFLMVINLVFNRALDFDVSRPVRTPFTTMLIGIYHHLLWYLSCYRVANQTFNEPRDC